MGARGSLPSPEDFSQFVRVRKGGGGGYYNNNNNKNPQLKEKLKERGWGRSPAPQQIASLHFSFVTPRRRRLPPPRRRTARRRGGSGGSRPATSPPSE